MSDQAYLELWDLTKSYPSSQGEAVIVKDVGFKFRKGEFVTVIGHSGCGKSTILMMVACLRERNLGVRVRIAASFSSRRPCSHG